MFHHLFPALALMLLTLLGPVQGLLQAGAPPARCCCGEGDANPGQGLGPCGMPKGPCAPRCPQSGTSIQVQAPALAVARLQQAQRQATAPRRESAPWSLAATAPGPFRAVAAPRAHGPPVPRFKDPQTGLRQFRI